MNIVDHALHQGVDSFRVGDNSFRDLCKRGFAGDSVGSDRAGITGQDEEFGHCLQCAVASLTRAC